MNVLILIVLTFIFIGSAIGLMDSIDHHYENSIPSKLGLNKYYWNTFYSWKNKYKNLNNEKRELKILAKLHIYYYDAWHTIKEYFLLSPISLLVSYITVLSMGYSYWYMIPFFLTYRISIGIGFKTTYR